MAKHSGNESRELLQQIQQEKIKGTVGKRFEDEFFALDLLKILYDDSEDAGVKTELLILLEEYGHLGLGQDSIDQLVTSLLDIYQQAVDSVANWTFVCQALVTSTSLLVQLQQLESEICSQLIKDLVAIVTTRVNQPDSQRLRCCACHCLVHMEEFQPGLLYHHQDEFIQLTRQERTQVYQDYAILSAKVMEYSGRMSDKSPGSPTMPQSKPMASKQKALLVDTQDLRQTAAMMLESAPLFTRCGSFRIMQSLVYLAKHQADIPPMMFKSLLLHQMPTMSCVLFHTVLHIQRQFEGEILTAKEEMDLVDRLCIMADHPCLNILHKLLASQWAMAYKQDEEGQPAPHACIIQRHRLKFYPSVFDPVDTQLSKLYMTSFCSDSSDDTDGMETSILLGSLGFLHKLVWHTGSGRAAIALFKALYFMYTTHNSQAFGTDIQRFVRGLIAEFPHFIPHSVDFIDEVRKLDVSSSIYVETLGLLHQQVVTATKEQIYHSYKFYLQILIKVAIETSIDQSLLLKFLCDLTESAAEIDDSSWKLGHDILEICRNLLTCHGTHKYFIALTDILETVPWKVCQNTVHIESLSRRGNHTSSRSTMSTSVITAFLSMVSVLYIYCKARKRATPFGGHQVSFYKWGLIACSLTACIDILEAANALAKNQILPQSWKFCFVLQVTHTSLYEWLGLCTLLAGIDAVCLLYKRGKPRSNLGNQKFVNLVCILLCISILVFNSMIAMFLDEVPTYSGQCRVGLTHSHGKLESKFSIGMLVWLLIQIVIVNSIFAYRFCYQRYKQKHLKILELQQAHIQIEPLMMSIACQTSASLENTLDEKLLQADNDNKTGTTVQDIFNVLSRVIVYFRTCFVDCEPRPAWELHGEINNSFNRSDEGFHSKKERRRKSDASQKSRKRSDTSMQVDSEGKLERKNSRARKRSLHMLYTIENFFVIDPDNTGIPVDTDSDGDEDSVGEANRIEVKNQSYEERFEEMIDADEHTKSMEDISVDVTMHGNNDDMEGGSDVPTDEPNNKMINEKRLQNFSTTDNDVTTVECYSGERSLICHMQEKKETENVLVLVRANDESKKVEVADLTEQKTLSYPMKVQAKIHDGNIKENTLHTSIGVTQNKEEYAVCTDEGDKTVEEPINDDETEREYEKDEVLLESSQRSSLLNRYTDNTSYEERGAGTEFEEDRENFNEEHAKEVEMNATNDTTVQIIESSYNEIAISLMASTDFKPCEKGEDHTLVKSNVRNSVRDVVWFMVVFGVGALPQLVYDVMNIVDEDLGSADAMQGFHTAADMAKSALFLIFCITFIWRFKVFRG